MPSQASTFDLERVFGHVTFPEELVTNVFNHLDHHSLLSCAKTSRLLNRLAVRYALEKGGIWNPEDVCELIPSNASSDTVRPFDFLLTSIHLKSFSTFRLFLDKLIDEFSVQNHLERFAMFLEKMHEFTSSFGLVFKDVQFLEYSPSAESETPLEDAIETVLNLAASKTLYGFLFHNWGAGILGEYSFKRARTERNGLGLLSSGSVANDELRYKRNPWSLRPFKYNPGVSSTLVYLETSWQQLRPPFSEWTFSLLENSPNFTSVSLSIGVSLSKHENQFILHRLATAAPAIDNMALYINISGILSELISELNHFPKLSTLTLQAEDPDGESLKDLDLNLPELEKIRTTPTIFHAILSRPEKPPRLPKLNTVNLSAPRGEANQFNLEQLANGVLKARELLRPQAADIGPSTPSESPASASPAPPSEITFCARIRFDSAFTALTPSIRDGTPPDLGSEQLSKALAEFKVLELTFPANTSEIQHGKYKQELMACLTIFPGVRHLRVRSQGTHGRPKKLDDSLFNSLVLHCPTLTEAWC